MINIPALRPTHAQIDLAALKYNLSKAKDIAAARGHMPKILLMVKANAYGHDILLISQYLQRERLCDMLGVATIEEGIFLRQNAVDMPALVLGSVYPFEYFEYALKNNLDLTIASARAANYIKDLAAKLKITANCHVKQETGMNRIGSRRPAALEILKILNDAPYINVRGCYTHIADADDKEYTIQQAEYFKEFLAEAAAQNLKTGMAHIAASGAFLNYKNLGFDMVRLGHLAYGLEDGFKPVLSLKSKVVFIKDIRPGAAVSYCCTYKPAKPSKIATIPIGYGDGYRRALSNKAQVLINGQKCPLVGNITMDMAMADITHLGDIPVGSEVVLIGGGITAKDVAAWAGTIDYEILTALTARVPRINV